MKILIFLFQILICQSCESLRILSDKKAFCPKDGMPLILVPKGIYSFGSNHGPYNQKPAFELSMDGFYMDAQEVSLSQYQIFLKQSGYQPKGRILTPDFNPDLPVTGLFHEDAQAYARWAQRELPGELHYEAAAQTSQIQVQNPCFQKPMPVYFGIDQNPSGILNLLGNVSEWTNDFYDRFRYEQSRLNPPEYDLILGPGPETPPALRFIQAGMIAGNERNTRIAIRGGAFGCHHPDQLNPKTRLAHHPFDGYSDVGFRLILKLP